MFNPLSQLNQFFRLATERKLSGSDQLMYLHLFNKFNQAHWPETLRIKDAELKDLMRLYDSSGKPMSIEMIRRGRQRLKAKGFIEVLNQGEDGHEPNYRMPRLYPINPPADPLDDPPDNPPDDPSERPNIRTREDALDDLDVKTFITTTNAGAREIDQVLDYWENELRGGRLTFEHQSELEVYLNRYGLEWVKEAMKAGADANNNPHGISPKYLFAVLKSKANPKPKATKGGDRDEKRDEYAKPPEYDFLDEWERKREKD